MKTKKIFIIQNFNFYLFFKKFFHLVRCNKIYIIKKIYPRNNFGIKYLFFSKFILKIFFKKKIQIIDDNDYNNLTYKANKKAISFINKNQNLFFNSNINFYLQNIIKSKYRLKYIQNVMSNLICEYYFIYLFLENIQKNNNKNQLYEIYFQEIPHFLEREFFDVLNLNKRVKLFLVRNTFIKFLFSILNILIPFLFIMTKLHKFKIVINKKKYQVIQPMLFGFNNDTNISNSEKISSNIPTKVSLIESDDYLYSKKIKKGNILHIYDNKWKFSKTEQSDNDNFMEKKGYNYLKIKNLKIDIRSIFQILRIYNYYYKLFIYKPNKNTFIDYVIFFKINYIYLSKIILLANIDYNKEFIRDDYNSRSTLEALINDEKKILTVAVQHHVHPIEYPPISFIFFNRYIVFSKLLSNFSAKYWKHIKIIKSGRENLDELYFLNKEIPKSKKEKIFNNTYKGNTKVLIILPKVYSRYFDMKVFNNLFLAIKKISINKKLQVKIFFKFRGRTDLEPIKSIINLSKEDKRLIIDTDYSTQELSILCDKVITHSTSFSIWELSALKKQFYILNLKPEVMKYYFRKIHKDIFIKSIDKIYETIISNKLNEKKLKINWNYLHDECNFYFDGKNKIRYQNSLNEI